MSSRHSLPVACFRVLIALVLFAALAGCGMINWSISNSGDGCPPQKTYPCP